MPLHPLDIVIFTVLALTTFQGLRRGLIRSLFDIVAFVCAIALALAWHGQIADFLTTTFAWTRDLTRVIGFFLVWVATYLVVSLIGNGLHRLIRSSIFGPINLLSGGLLGLTKGTLLIGLFLQFALALPLPPHFKSGIHNAQSTPWILPLAQLTFPFFLQSSAYLLPHQTEHLPTQMLETAAPSQPQPGQELPLPNAYHEAHHPAKDHSAE